MAVLAITNLKIFSYEPYEIIPSTTTEDGKDVKLKKIIQRSAKALANDVLNPINVITDTRDTFHVKKQHERLIVINTLNFSLINCLYIIIFIMCCHLSFFRSLKIL
jgi:hypothetical protein